MVAHHVQEGIAVSKRTGAMDGVAVASWFVLRNEPDRRSVGSGGLRIRALIAGKDYNSNFLGASREGLFNQGAEQRLLVAFAVDKGLKRQVALGPPGSGNECFPD
jgi:hypothetical protein